MIYLKFAHLVVSSLTPPTGIEHKALVYELKLYKRLGLVQSRQHHHLIEIEIVLVMI